MQTAKLLKLNPQFSTVARLIFLSLWGLLSFNCCCDKKEPPVWTQTLENPEVSGAIYDVIRTETGFFAVGCDGTPRPCTAFTPVYAAVWTSEDGIEWTRVPHDDDVFGNRVSAIFTIVAGGPGYVAGGYEDWQGAPIWTSEDGETWERAATLGPEVTSILGTTDNNEVNDIILTTDGELIAVGRKFDGGNAVGAIWHCTGGEATAWTEVFTQPFDPAPGSETPRRRYSSIKAITETNSYIMSEGGPKYIAVGYYYSSDRRRKAAIWVSDDGLNWEMLPPYDPVFVITDEPYDGNAGDQELNGVIVWNNAVYVAGKDSEYDSLRTKSMIWRSVDLGETWGRLTDPPFEEQPDFAVRHSIYGLINTNAFGFAALAVGTVGEDDNLDGEVWRYATTGHAYRYNYPVFKGEGAQGVLDAVGTNIDGKTVIIAVGYDNGSPAIWRLARPEEE